ncbi:MAG TPA: hypothetical protein IGS52_17345 [Oscillatoriaceae cyanobacterium M33_DOE_052]|uniref:Uncharacterized protein n=1 Tax=Planktothricoides sp. SpSt-374 TaxID=2282167 RepID=A0A7C3ZXX0_9CYAN|nr:hypothetical protein [Oscillatoriaceae cyanobacterium M33_DOE_052]
MQYQNDLSLRLGAIWNQENRQIVAATVDLIGYDSQLRSPNPQTIARGSRFQSKSGNLGFQLQSAVIALRTRSAEGTGAAFLSQRGRQKGATYIFIAGGAGA